jgi:hypothetical protein
MPVTQRDGAGTYLTMGTSGFSAEITNELSGFGKEFEAIETTGLQDVGGKTFIPSKQYNPGQLSLEIAYEAGLNPPVGNDPEVISIYLSGGASAISCSGFMLSCMPKASVNDRVAADCVIQLSGEIAGL